jgi:tetratricopeptide (TPR) repeat protein
MLLKGKKDMTQLSRCIIIVIMAAWGAGCARPGSVADQGPPPKPRLFEGMGEHHRTVATSSPEAQKYFDQGLVWLYAFNHDEAIRSFAEAARLDPNCAMAWWGIALANGPHINNPAMDAEHSRAAWQALAAARERAAGATPVEQALIAALSQRYAETPPTDRKGLDEAYARAMREVWKTHRQDMDVGTLFAEAMMDLRPWDLWTRDGKPQPGTEEIVATLEEVQRYSPNHPGALHLYIHAVEGSPTPERAMDAADRLCRLVPASGHLMHMPSHIYARTGHWKEAGDTNVRAVAADAAYRAIRPRQGFYRLYMAHNAHFLSYAAMMRGQGELAIRTARDVANGIPEDFSRAFPDLADSLMGAPYDALKRFGRWDAILGEPKPPSRFPFTRAMWRFARGIAYAARGEIAAARREQSAFRRAASRVKLEMPIGNNKAGAVLAVAEHLLEGEILFAEGTLNGSVAALREAVACEEKLAYNEPPDWVQPARHTLGVVLLSARRYDEAEKVYREDLQKLRNDGWALYGLSECLREKGDAKAAAEIKREFTTAWADADTAIGASCLCAQRRK